VSKGEKAATGGYATLAVLAAIGCYLGLKDAATLQGKKVT
jgi:hypothetical protein